MTSARHIVVVAALAVLAGVIACTAFDGLSVPEDPKDASIDTSVPADAGADVDPCQHARVPTPPPFTAGGDIDFTVVLRSLIATADGGSSSQIGLDLDGVCTCNPHGESCVSGSTTPQCDGPGGRDNATGTLLESLAGLGAFDLGELGKRGLENGKTALLVRVQRYNGQPDDSEITVGLYRSSGPYDDLADGGIAKRPPTFAPNEKWTVNDKTLLPGTQIPTISATGYVRNGTLVALVTQSVLPLDADFVIQLNDALLVARVVAQGNGAFALEEGLVVGRWPTRDLLVNLGKVKQPNSDERLCDKNPALLSILRDRVCKSVDVSSLGSLDNANSPCNALSFAIGFSATPAVLGQTVVEVSEPLCPDSGLSECP